MFSKGTKVVQVLPEPFKGEVAGFALCQETGEVHIKVEHEDSDGVIHSRFFKESELQASEG